MICNYNTGGYFVSIYALKYPEKVENLILASPAGKYIELIE